MRTAVGDPPANSRAVLEIARECHEERAAVAVFPELALTGYSLDDILMQDALLDAVENELQRITQASAELMPVLVIGAPLRYLHRIYNTAVVIHRGRVLGAATKSYLPTYREFYELRQMAAGDDICGEICLDRSAPRVHAPLGPDLLFTASDVPGFTLHVEICEDMWIPVPPSAHAALAGATVLANLSGSPVTIGRAEERCLLARSASLRCTAAYIYAAAGEGESTTDLAWDGQTMIWENGVCLAQSQRFPNQPKHCVADVDLDLLCSTRRQTRIFDANRKHHRLRRASFREIEFVLDSSSGSGSG
jgi:NAD+ synthase (glutamine-hydrolysing)